MSKNIVICCDGTGNHIGSDYSNVLHLYSCLYQDDQVQIAYYDSGVGTVGLAPESSSIGQYLSIIKGMAMGRGLKTNVKEAYSFLSRYYEEGDNVFLFGFSRGAYTVRVLCGFIRMFGLVNAKSLNLFDNAFQIYGSKMSSKNNIFRIAGDFKHRFAQDCPIHFIGVWDTVSSVLEKLSFRSYPFTAQVPNANIIRHAISIDEKRIFFPSNKFDLDLKNPGFRDEKKQKQDFKRVYFSGVHSDVGGSYPDNESGLSKYALHWMMSEASLNELKIIKNKFEKYVLGKTDEFQGPDYNQEIHNSLTSAWKVIEIFPRVKRKKGKITSVYFDFARSRKTYDEDLFHYSVDLKMKNTGYSPKNIPESPTFTDLHEPIKFLE